MSFLIKLDNLLRRTASAVFFRRDSLWPGKQPYFSFSFDDFPRSALLVGGEILRSQGFRGTFFASLGLMGRNFSTGEIFNAGDLREAIQNGHEIGSHTFGHLNPWTTHSFLFEQGIRANKEALQKLFPDYLLKTFSYPFTRPSPRNKRIAGRHFSCCRGGGQRNNLGRIDLNLLKSFFIDKKNRDNLEYFNTIIEENIRRKGWLIFSTHDIDENPTDFGCRPAVLEEVVNIVARSSAIVLPIVEVYQKNIEANSAYKIHSGKAS